MSALQPLAEAAGGFSALLGALVHYVLAPLITLISCLLSIFVVLGNLLVVTAIWHENQLHTVTNYLIASLAAADCLVGAVVMPFNIISEIILGSWTFGSTWCDLWHSFDVLASTASIMNLCAISLDRYLAITNPISYPTKMTPKRVAFLIVSIWTCSSLISFPAIFWWHAVSPGGPLREIGTSAPERHRTNLTNLASNNLNSVQPTATTISALSDLAPEAAAAASFAPGKAPAEPEVHQQAHIQVDSGLEYKCVFTDDTYYLLFSSFISFYGPLCVMLYAYYCIYRAAVQQTRFLKYGSKQVMVGGGKRARHVSELSASQRNEKWSSSERDCDGYSQNGSHDRQRLVLRVHRGGGGAASAQAALSTSSHKSTSDASNQQQQANNNNNNNNSVINSNSYSSSLQKRNNKVISSAGSCRLESGAAAAKKCDIKSAASGCTLSSPANSIANGDTSSKPNGSPPRFVRQHRHSRRDELRVRSQRFDSNSSLSVPAVTKSNQTVVGGGGSHDSLPLMKQQSSPPNGPAAECEREADHRKVAASFERLLEQRSTTITSDTSTDSRGSIVTVEPRGLDEDLRAVTTTSGRRRQLSSESRNSGSQRTLANSPPGAQPAQASDATSIETDELLSRTRDALHRFNRTISLESALEQKRKRAPIQVTINLGASGQTADTNETSGGGGATRVVGKPAANSIGGRQAAPAAQDPDKLIRSIVDLSAIHYIDCTNQSYGLARLAAVDAPSSPRSASSPTGSSRVQPASASVVAVAGVRSQRGLGKTMSQLEPSSRLSTLQMSSGGASPANSVIGATSSATSNAPEQQQQQQQQQQQNGKKLTKLAKERKAAKTLGIVVGVFILCWLPFFVVNIMVATCGASCIYKPDILLAIVTWLGWLNSAMNPVIYACWSRDFRRAFRKTLCTWVEFVCYDGASVARRLKLKKGSSYMNTQEAFLSKHSGVSMSKCAQDAAGLSNSHRSAISIEIDACSRNPSSDV